MLIKLSPMERMAYWITEREGIRLRRKEGKPFPWTDDTILRQYRFCNVRRMDDKVSSWLYDNWYKPNFDHKNMVTAVCLARFFNNIPTLDFMKFPRGYNPKNWVDGVREWKSYGNNTFAAAYVVRGNDGEDKIDSVVNYYVASAIENKSPWLDTSSMENSVNGLKECFGYGSFMAGQVVADLRWAIKGTWADKLTWAAKGPGSRRGMNRLHNRPIEAPLSQTQFMDELTEMMETLKTRLPQSITRRMEAIDYQNCCCEYDKYSRTIFEGRRPKQNFRSPT